MRLYLRGWDNPTRIYDATKWALAMLNGTNMLVASFIEHGGSVATHFVGLDTEKEPGPYLTILTEKGGKEYHIIARSRTESEARKAHDKKTGEIRVFVERRHMDAEREREAAAQSGDRGTCTGRVERGNIFDGCLDYDPSADNKRANNKHRRDGADSTGIAVNRWPR